MIFYRQTQLLRFLEFSTFLVLPSQQQHDSIKASNQSILMLFYQSTFYFFSSAPAILFCIHHLFTTYVLNHNKISKLYTVLSKSKLSLSQHRVESKSSQRQFFARALLFTPCVLFSYSAGSINREYRESPIVHHRNKGDK